jgi:hypothetical protein
MMAELITSHVWRSAAWRWEGEPGDRHPARGDRCGWLGTCDRPEADHITPADFRTRPSPA